MVDFTMAISAQVVVVYLVAAFALDRHYPSDWEAMSSKAQEASSGNPSLHTSWLKVAANSAMASVLEPIATTLTIESVEALARHL